jgi:hypothetical protein
MRHHVKGWLYIVLGVAALPLFLAGGGFLKSPDGQALAVVCLGAWIAGLVVLGPLVVRSMLRSREAAREAAKPSPGRYAWSFVLVASVMAGWHFLMPVLMKSSAGQHGFVIMAGLCLSIFVAQGVGFLRMPD